MTTQTQTLTYRCPHCQQPVEVEVHPENELLVCPNPGCRKPFKVDVPTAEPVKEPLILPPGHEEAAHPAAPPAQPATEPPEEIIQTVRVAMFRRYPFRCLGYILFLVASLGGVLIAAMNDSTTWVVICLVLTAVLAGRLFWWWLRMQNTLLTITNKRCILESGVFTKKVADLPVTDIEDIQIHQSFVQDMLNVGDLTLLSHKGELQRFVIMAVPAPKDVAARIRALTTTKK